MEKKQKKRRVMRVRENEMSNFASGWSVVDFLCLFQN